MYSASYEQQERERARAHRARQQTDPARDAHAWQPQHRRDCAQDDTCACPQIRAYASTADQIGYGGAAGGGKSEALLMAALQYIDTPSYAALLLRRSFRD